MSFDWTIGFISGLLVMGGLWLLAEGIKLYRQNMKNIRELRNENLGRR